MLTDISSEQWYRRVIIFDYFIKVQYMKKNKTFLYTFVFISFISAMSCNDPVFYTIYKEPPKIDPLVKGSPTNFVGFDGYMYVASGKTLYWYIDGQWAYNNPVDYRIIQLAATPSYIYLLCNSDNDESLESKIFYKGTSGDWTELSGFGDYKKHKTIYTADDILYIGTQHKDKDITYEVLRCSGAVVEQTPYITETSILYGAAYSGTTTFICTKKTVYADTAAIGTGDYVGIIKLHDGTAAVLAYSGELFTADGTSLTSVVPKFSDERRATGAIAVWKEDINAASGNSRLLVGRGDISYSTSSGYIHGYVELQLSDAGGIEGTSYDDPGGTNSSIRDYQSYASSLGVNPINSIFQAPNGILFAATQKNGVFSYKHRNDGTGEAWNAED